MAFELTRLWHQIISYKLSLVCVKFYELEVASAESQAYSTQSCAHHLSDKIVRTCAPPKSLDYDLPADGGSYSNAAILN